MNVALCEVCGEQHELGYCARGWDLPDPKPPRERMIDCFALAAHLDLQFGEHDRLCLVCLDKDAPGGTQLKWFKLGYKAKYAQLRHVLVEQDQARGQNHKASPTSGERPP
ncbi:hypothetical protein JQ596_16015 [Bradyrhizobium manausense]|uniref:hypothetical protein n=1 Tax=Bradyrhizobium manausense TaxID=989370 RepID=UPI001BA876B0|nr:hypothetical protein [Bradyrhizobium manausense]MBR0827047.1 hypothetical protein [Bradyrhizobium manausense]